MGLFYYFFIFLGGGEEGVIFVFLFLVWICMISTFKPIFFIEIYCWSDGMRCCRSDWPGLCLFCYHPLCIVSQQSWFWAFFLFHKFYFVLPPPPDWYAKSVHGVDVQFAPTYAYHPALSSNVWGIYYHNINNIILIVYQIWYVCYTCMHALLYVIVWCTCLVDHEVKQLNNYHILYHPHIYISSFINLRLTTLITDCVECATSSPVG